MLRRDYRYRVLLYARSLFANQHDVRVRAYSLGDEFREALAVNCERRARGHARLRRRVEHERAAATQLLFQKIGGRARLVRLQRVRADDLGKLVRPMRRSLTRGTHLEQAHARSALRGLPCGLDAREASADDYNIFHKSIDE